MTDIDLHADQLKAIMLADAQAQEALALLGEVDLANESARVAHEKTEQRLIRMRRAANGAVARRDDMMRALATLVNLPDGDWVLDRENSKLVRRGASHD